MITVNSRKHFLLSLRSYLPEKCITVELGVLHGDFSQLIIETLNPKKLLLIDPYKIDNSQTYGEEMNYLPIIYSTNDDYVKLTNRFRNEIYLGKVIVIRKRSYEAVDYVADNSIDFLYNDASHLYKDLKMDLNDWLPKLKEGGIVSGHDYINSNGFGVIDAVDEFCEEHNFQMVAFNNDGGDWALKIK